MFQQDNYKFSFHGLTNINLPARTSNLQGRTASRTSNSQGRTASRTSNSQGRIASRTSTLHSYPLIQFKRFFKLDGKLVGKVERREAVLPWELEVRVGNLIPKLLSLIFLFLFFGKNTIAQTSQDSIAQLDLLFVGDVMGHAPQIRSAKKGDTYDYTPCFQYLEPIIDQADLAIANLEVTLPGEPPYQGYPNFRSPDELALALRLAGFDMLVTSNNHSNDAGKKGVVNTINTVKDLGFYQTGTFLTKEERELYYPLIVYKNDFKLAFLNYTYDTNGRKTIPPTFVNLIDTTLIKEDMAKAKLLKPDAIIVVMHWGKEYKLIESKKQNRLAQQVFNWGADLVIGMHPHVIQPIREYEIPQEDGTVKKTLVTYSLGNFISNQTKPNTNGGLMFEISLLKDLKTNKVELGEHHYIPVFRYIHRDAEGKATYYAIPVSAYENGNEEVLDMNTTAKTEMKVFAKKTRTHLQQFSSSERKIELSELGTVKKLESKKAVKAKK